MFKAHMRNLVQAIALIVVALVAVGIDSASGSEPLVIAASPSMAVPLEAIGQAFEKTHPDVKVRIYFDSSLDLRRTIAAVENNSTGKYFIGTGPIHLVAPGGDELITRLEQKYYVLPGTRRAYAAVPLVMVVPESLVEAPTSFEALAQGQKIRVAVADPILTTLGQRTKQLFEALGLLGSLKGRMDVGSDTRSVLDHVLSGQADVGIVFGPDAAKESERVRVVAVSDSRIVRPTVHSMAMERYCPNRHLCEEFLDFTQSPDAQALLARLGYVAPNSR
jgi:molybdate transport system substrate-binding protein